MSILQVRKVGKITDKGISNKKKNIYTFIFTYEFFFQNISHHIQLQLNRTVIEEEDKGGI